MKFILLAIILLSYTANPTHAQSNPNSTFSLIDLNLSPEQRSAMRAAILEYRHSEKMRREQLRAKLFQILTRRQQATVLHWRRIHR